MSQTISLNAKVRTKTGTRDSARLRETGFIPAVVYGHKQEPLSIALDAHAFLEELHRGHRIFDVKLEGGKNDTLLVKEVQYDYLGKDIIHVDMMRVDLNERVKVEVPIEIRGTAAGISEGGMLDELVTSLEIECAVNSIPETLVVQVKDLALGQSIHAKDIELPAGVTLLTDPETLVVICHAKAGEIAAAAEEGQAPEGPEVITERNKEE